MKKTWRNVIIISLILVVIEITATFILVHPYFETQLVYNSISEGNWIETKENYDKLSSTQMERVQEYLPAYAAWEARQYATGEVTYEEAAATFDAINAIDESGTLYSTFMYDISKNEYVKVFRELHRVETSFDNTEIYTLRQTLNAISLRLDNSSREELLVMLLNEKYQEFLDEEISVDSAKSFVSLVVSNSIYDAYEYALVIGNNIDCVVNYRAIYENAKLCFDEEDYFTAMDLCSDIKLDPKDTTYQTLFSDLYTQAYDTGKTYYGEKLDYYVMTGANEEAVNLMAEIDLRYGDDFDTGDYKEDLAEDWQKACVELASNWESDLKANLAETETGEYILDNEYDNLKPDSLLLYDVDGNEIPELFLFNSSRADNSYVECFVYAYVEDEYKYMDYINVMNFCNTSSLVAFPTAFDRTVGEECVLVEFDGTSFTFGTECQKIEDVYYVDGYEVSDADYLSAQSKVLANINEKVIGNSKYSSLTDSERYILSY